VSLGPSLLPHPREIPIIRDETQIESMDGGKKRTGRRKRGRERGGDGMGKRGTGKGRKESYAAGEENWNLSGTEDDKIADGQVLL